MGGKQRKKHRKTHGHGAQTRKTKAALFFLFLKCPRGPRGTYRQDPNHNELNHLWGSPLYRATSSPLCSPHLSSIYGLIFFLNQLSLSTFYMSGFMLKGCIFLISSANKLHYPHFKDEKLGFKERLIIIPRSAGIKRGS